jgi:Mg2+ and Co2+ transporter CorA
MKHLAVSSHRCNDAILDLSQKSATEAEAMKSLTIVAVLFVPASFVAVSQVSFTLVALRGRRQED